jgi:hypothetical protein
MRAAARERGIREGIEPVYARGVPSGRSPQRGQGASLRAAQPSQEAKPQA